MIPIFMPWPAVSSVGPQRAEAPICWGVRSSCGPYVVVATWDSAEDYQVWVNSPVRGELSATPPQLSQPVAPADLYEIVERFE